MRCLNMYLYVNIKRNKNILSIKYADRFYLWLYMIKFFLYRSVRNDDLFNRQNVTITRNLSKLL